MKTLMLHISDDSKVQLFMNFMREIRFVRIEEIEQPVSKTKKMTELPQSVLNPVRVKQFRMYSRDELYDRKSVY
jgi:hypothetical protein